MTTAAYRDGVLAVDRQTTEGNVVFYSTKLHRTKTHAIACAGTLVSCLAFFEWWKEGREGDCPLDKNTVALVLDRQTGKCQEWSREGVPFLIEDRFTAIGSGQQIALGAMSFGASAVEAVKCAIEWDAYTGLGVNYCAARNKR